MSSKQPERRDKPTQQPSQPGRPEPKPAPTPGKPQPQPEPQGEIDVPGRQNPPQNPPPGGGGD